MKINRAQQVGKAIKAYDKPVLSSEKTKKSIIPTDQLQISKQGKEYQLALNALKALPEIRTDKVEMIKSQRASGEYSPGAQKILDQLFSRNM